MIYRCDLDISIKMIDNSVIINNNIVPHLTGVNNDQGWKILQIKDINTHNPDQKDFILRIKNSSVGKPIAFQATESNDTAIIIGYLPDFRCNDLRKSVA